MDKHLSVVGKSPEMTGAREKVTGKGKYTVDMKLPGMLYAKILRSPYAHAKILEIDASEAERLSGVKAILTYKEAKLLYVPGHGRNVDEFALDDRVRYAGDKVAAVAAESNDTAEAALEQIHVKYDVLPALLDPAEAMKPDAPKIHPELSNLKGNFQVVHKKAYGDIERGFREADHIVENRYTTSRVCHCSLEPHVCVASWNEEGRLTMWSSDQTAFAMRDSLCNALNLPMSKVRVVIPVHVGGGFGGKYGSAEGIVCALLARKAGRPVMLELSREEEFYTTRTRSPCIFETKTGFEKDGTFTARYVKAIVDLGAYAYGAVMAERAGFYHMSLYRCPNTAYDGYGVYTNNPPSGPMRGFTSTPIDFAIESDIDEVARELGMDPLELRLKNSIKTGDVIPYNDYDVTSSGLDQCMLLGSKRIGWERRQKNPGEVEDVKKRGIGMGIFIHFAPKLAGPNERSVGCATVRINDDGSVNLFLGTPEIGQGLTTTMAQIVAEELGARLQDVNVTVADTEKTPWGVVVSGSRTTVETGGAAKAAAVDAKRRLFEMASKLLKVPAGELLSRDSRIYVSGTSDKGVSFSELLQRSDVRAHGDNIIVCTATYQMPKYVPPFGAQFAEVEVDTETGQVKVVNIVAAHDVGRAINPTIVEGQIEGGVLTGIGYGLTEELVLEKTTGQTINPDFLDYKLLRAADVSKIETILVEPVDPVSVFGVKGIGEMGAISVAPAIANAIYNATGARIRELPMSPERILKALRTRRE